MKCKVKNGMSVFLALLLCMAALFSAFPYTGNGGREHRKCDARFVYFLWKLLYQLHDGR